MKTYLLKNTAAVESKARRRPQIPPIQTGRNPRLAMRGDSTVWMILALVGYLC